MASKEGQKITNKIPFINVEQLKRALRLLMNANIPAMILGGVGCGKTSGVHAFVDEYNEDAAAKSGKKEGKFKKDLELWTVILSYLEATDIGGVPYPTTSGDKAGRLDYLMPSFLPFDTDQKGVLFGDEFDRANPETQNAWLQFLLGREFHGHTLSPNVYVIMAGNGTSDVFTTPLSKAARTRMCFLYVSPKAAKSTESYDLWAEKNGVHPLVRTFAKFNYDLLDAHEEFEEQAIMTRRTGDMAGKIIQAAEAATFRVDDILAPCISGVIGKAAAMELLSIKELMDKAPTLDEIMDKPDKARIPAEPSIVYAVGLQLIGYQALNDRKTAEKVAIYMSRVQPEQAAHVFRRLIDKCPSVVTTRPYLDWSKEHSDLLN